MRLYIHLLSIKTKEKNKAEKELGNKMGQRRQMLLHFTGRLPIHHILPALLKKGDAYKHC